MKIERLTVLTQGSIEQNFLTHTSVLMSLCSTSHIRMLPAKFRAFLHLFVTQTKMKKQMAGVDLDPLLNFY